MAKQYYKEVENLLERTKEIRERYDEIATKNGENFNIFKIMNMEWNEVYTHSAIIGELLNPRGSHSFGNLFLNSFIELINKNFGIEIQAFHRLVDEKICERTITLSNDWNNVYGGRIDIILEDSKQILLIENKPSAKDQEYQLIRYYNYAKTKNKDFFIIYLTLDEKELGDEKEYINEFGSSITGKNFSHSKKKEYDKFKLENKNPNNHCCLYYQITFKNEILEWLEICINLTKEVPLISETLKQYRNNIKNITNQNLNDNMSLELKRLITEENVESIVKLSNEVEEITRETKHKFEESVNKRIRTSKHSVGINETITGSVFKDDGFYLGFQYYQGETPINVTPKGKELTEKLKKQFPKIGSNQHFIAWYLPEYFLNGQHFENLDLKVIIKMYHNNEYLEKFVDDIAKEFDSIKDFINKEIEQQ